MSLLLSFLLGFILLNFICCPNQDNRKLLFVFSLPLGMAASSLIAFYALLFFEEAYLSYAIAFHFLIILSLAIYRSRIFLNEIRVIGRINFRLQSRHYSLIFILFLFILFSSVFIKKYPHGFWDAFTMWNLKAKVMFYESRNWLSFIRYFQGSDYPLLLPLNIFWGWGMVGNDTAFIPIAISLCFSLSLIFIIFVFILRVSGFKLALLSVLLAVCAPQFIKTINYQFADSLLSCYILIAGICFLLALDEKKKSFAWLAGFSTGAACFTKNEGLLFFAVIYFIFLCYSLFDEDRQYLIKVIAYSLLACLPFLITALVFKKIINIPNNILNVSRINDFPKLILDQTRINIILYSLFKESNRWSLFFYCFLSSFILNFANFFKKPVKVVTFAIFLTALGYLFTYLIVPGRLQWCLDSSLYRLMLHFFPLSLILMFYCSFREEKNENRNS